MADFDPLYAYYKRARNQLRRYEPKSVINHVIGALYKAHHEGAEVLKHYQPWNLLLLLKWMSQEIDATAHHRPPATLNEVHNVLNILHEMEGAGQLPSDYAHLSLYMRRLAFQQFWLHRPDGSALARQEILFGELPISHLFNRQFVEATGVTISDFLDLGFALLSLLLGDNPPQAFNRSIFENIEPRLTPGALDSFLNYFSRSLEDLGKWLNEPLVREISVSDQLVLPSPLLRAPLLRLDSMYIVYYPPLVYRALEQSIYRALRSINLEAFMQRFGPMFERYMGQCLLEAGVKFTDEATLKSQIPGGKCVDFLVVEKGCNIMIDAKGVEMSALGRVAMKAEIVYRAIKESAMKAVVQGMETARRIDALPPEAPWGRQENYLLVITFEQLYLGPSCDLAATFGPTLTDGLKRQFGEPFPFPLENVFFASIGEFEDLLELIRANSTTLLSALIHAKASDAARLTRKFNFGQHLESLGNLGEKLPIISAALDRIQQRCINNFSTDMRK